MSTQAASSQKLLQCLIRLEQKDPEAKMDLVLMTNELMPQGKPQFQDMIKFPTISNLVQTEGRRKMLAVLVLLVKDFCGSVNVVRNMNEDQMIEAAAMLLEECGNFRLEDYTMMFAMAKRGQLVKIYDRIDMQIVTEILDMYWTKRHKAGIKAQEEDVTHIDSLGSVGRKSDNMNPMDEKLLSAGETFTGAMDELRSKLTDWRPTITETEAQKQIYKNPNYKNPYPEPGYSE